jgi:hypothetical protein
MDGLGREEQHLARSDNHLPVPHSLRNEARLTVTETNGLFLGALEIRTEEYVYLSFKEVQQLILFGMYFPLVAHSGCLHGKDAHVTTRVWGHVGQSRTVVTTDGGTMRELLTEVDAPHSFGYRLSDISGPMRPLVDSIDGRWEFVTQGTGTLITWRWTLHPKGLGAYVMRPITLMWRAYAGQALGLLSEQLIAADSA